MIDPASRLAAILTELEKVGLTCLVLTGHAARFYGVNRTTNDFDLHLAPDAWPDLSKCLSHTSLFAGQAPVDGPSWRPTDFRRFQIGRLSDGRQEWLEFWRTNHLLAPFPDLFTRREEGMYGGRQTAFLSLPDLIRSKETERESDWLDVEKLEEILDARLLASVGSTPGALVAALAQLRSRVGLQGYFERKLLADPAVVDAAVAQATNPISVAWLLPCAPQAAARAPFAGIEPVLSTRLASVSPATPLHFALVEAVRRGYKAIRKEADRTDKQAMREAQAAETPPS